MDEGNKLRKAIKKEIRKYAQSYYKNKVIELFTTKLKNGYSKVKKLCGRSQGQLDFNLSESPEVAANNLKKFFASIVQSLLALSYQSPTDDLPPAFPSLSPHEIK